MLSSDQIGFYRENGYLAVPGVVGRERIGAAAAALGRLIERSRQVCASDAVYDLEDTHRPDNPRVRRIKDPPNQRPAPSSSGSRRLVYPGHIGIFFHPRLAMTPSVSHNPIVGRGQKRGQGGRPWQGGSDG